MDHEGKSSLDYAKRASGASDELIDLLVNNGVNNHPAASAMTGSGGSHRTSIGHDHVRSSDQDDKLGIAVL